MRRIFLLAQRDYLQMIRSKAYLVGLILFPLLIGGGFMVVSLTSKSDATKVQRVAVIDRTGVSAASVIQAAEEANRRAIVSGPFGNPGMPRFVFEEVKPEGSETRGEPDVAAAAQLLTLSNRIRAGDLSLAVDISPEVIHPSGDDPKQILVRYYTNSGGLVDQVSLWLPVAVNDGLRRVRLTQLGVDPARITGVLQGVAVVPMNLVSKDPVTGNIVQGEKRNPIQAGAVPFFLVFLLYIIAIFGSAPNLGAVAEDKVQRVYEMLLVSASAFELMMGKVLAAVAASLTSSIVYILGGLAVLVGMALFGLAPLHLLPWFFLYVIADVLMLASLGVALGSACSSSQDAQHFAFLLILPLMIPMFVLTPIMLQPNGGFAVAMSFIPPFTPVVMLLRQALPGGVPWWQPWLALLGVVVWATIIIWAAARIFRIGILSQGKTPQLGELAQWVLRA